MFCVKCQTEIPELRDAPSGTESRIRLLLVDGRTMMAMSELRSATGWSEEWAKVWVAHRGYPCDLDGDAPCPYCGEPLRTAYARQCRHCHRDWHDPNNVKVLTDG
jgi:hypothetical protein